MELNFTSEQRAFRDELRAYFAKMMTDALVAELSSGGEGGGPEFRSAMKQMGQDGLLGISWPKEYGGQERSAIEQFIFADEVQAVGFPLPFLTLSTVGPTLRQYGTEEQKRYFCPKILAGEIFFAIGYSEPAAGTDLASLQTTAADDGATRRRRVGHQWAEDVDQPGAICRLHLAGGPHRPQGKEASGPLDVSGADGCRGLFAAGHRHDGGRVDQRDLL